MNNLLEGSIFLGEGRGGLHKDRNRKPCQQFRREMMLAQTKRQVVEVLNRQTKIGFWMQFENGAYSITEKLHIEYKKGARMSPCIFMLSARPELPFTEKRKMKVRTTGAEFWIHHF